MTVVINGTTGIDTGTGSLIAADSTTATYLDMFEDTDNGSNYVRLIAPASIAANRTVTLPNNTGTLLSTASTGTVLQVVQTVKTDVFSSNSTSTFVDITGMSVSITPSSASNQILVTYSLCTSIVNGGYSFHVRLLRGSTDIAQGTSSGSIISSTTSAYSSSSSGEYPMYVQNMTFLDSPATTSSTTYKLQGRGWNQTAGLFYVNRSAAEVNNANFARTVSTITVMEIAG